MRGEYKLIILTMTRVMELPPRARRIPVPSTRRGTPMGTTSACAENTVTKKKEPRFTRNYLRVRGEYAQVRTVSPV